MKCLNCGTKVSKKAEHCPNCGEKITKKKGPKKFLIIFFFLLFLVALLIGLFVLYQIKLPKIGLEDSKMIGIVSDNEYFIGEASPSIAFKLNKRTKNYTVTSSDGEKIKTSLKWVKGDFYIVSDNYTKGEVYTLEIKDKDAYLTDENLKKGKKVTFVIKRDEVANYSYHENVYNDEVTINEDNTLSSSNTYKAGDIIITQNNAYKVTGINDGKISYTTPELAEIYEDFDLYENINLDKAVSTPNQELLDRLNNAKINIDENKVVEAVKNSNTYQNIVFLADESKSEVTDDFSFELTEDNHVLVTISLKVSSNETPFLGIEALKNHSISFKFTFEVAINLTPDFKLGKHLGLNAQLISTYNLDVDISANSDPIEGFKELSDEEYDKTVQDIVKRLEGMPHDSAEGSVTVGALEIPTEIPLVNVYIDIYFTSSLSMNLEATYHQDLTITETAGFMLDKNGLTTYNNQDSSDSGFNLEAQGKVDASVGFGLDLGVSFISKDIAHANVKVELGLYASAFIAGKLKAEQKNDVDTEVIAKVEVGIYAKVNAQAGIDFVFKKMESEPVKIVDARRAFATLGSSLMPNGIKTEETSVSSRNGKVKIPNIYLIEIDLLNEDKETETKLSPGMLKFTDSDDKELKANGDYLEVGKKNTTVTVTYDTWHQHYKATFNVKYSGSSSSENLNTSKDDDIDKEEETNKETITYKSGITNMDDAIKYELSYGTAWVINDLFKNGQKKVTAQELPEYLLTETMYDYIYDTKSDAYVSDKVFTEDEVKEALSDLYGKNYVYNHKLRDTSACASLAWDDTKNGYILVGGCGGISFPSDPYYVKVTTQKTNNTITYATIYVVPTADDNDMMNVLPPYKIYKDDTLEEEITTLNTIPSDSELEKMAEEVGNKFEIVFDIDDGYYHFKEIKKLN